MAKTTVTTYAADDGTVYPIRIGSDVYEALTASTGGPATSKMFVQNRKTNREYGLRPRQAVLYRIVGAAPNDFKRYKRIPALTAASFNSQLTIGATIEIGANTWTVLRQEDEDY